MAMASEAATVATWVTPAANVIPAPETVNLKWRKSMPVGADLLSVCELAAAGCQKLCEGKPRLELKVVRTERIAPEVVVAEVRGFDGEFAFRDGFYRISDISLGVSAAGCSDREHTTQPTLTLEARDVSNAYRNSVACPSVFGGMNNKWTGSVSFELEVKLTKAADSGTNKGSLVGDLVASLDEESSADCAFVCGAEKVEVRCSQFVLAARSDVFRAKFSGRWGLRHTVFEEDVGAEVVRAFVSFLYTDKIKFKDTGDKDSVDDLLALLGMADKYNELTQARLAAKMDEENAAAMLAEGQRRPSCKRLKRTACDFVLSKRSRVVGTEGWRKAAEAMPELPKEVLELRAEENGIEGSEEASAQ